MKPRSLLLLSLLALIGCHQKATPPKIPNPTQPIRLPEITAWKETETSPNGPRSGKIVLLNGRRWRTEILNPSTRRTRVTIFDGERGVDSDGADVPPPPKDDILRAPAVAEQQVISSLSGSTPQSIEERNGHVCWHFVVPPPSTEVESNLAPVRPQVGVRVISHDVWIDQATKFLVAEEVQYADQTITTQYELLPADFAQDKNGVFSIESIAPRFLGELKK
jgi:hypothetical protein